jgi:MarR family transcriptional regulator for hemolysin
MWLVLWTLETGDYVTQRELAHALDIREPTLTHHLDNLESSGLVCRLREPADRRAIRVELTPAGHAMFGTLRELAERFNRQLAKGITRAEERQLRRVLERLASNAKAELG